MKFSAQINLSIEAEDIGEASRHVRILHEELDGVSGLSVTGSAVGGGREDCSNCNGAGSAQPVWQNGEWRTRCVVCGTGQRERVGS